NYMKNLVKPNGFKSFAKSAGTGVLAEGFFEEGMQSTVEGMFSKSAMNNELTENPINDFNLQELVENYAETLSTTDGQSAIFLGSLLGGVMNGVGGIREAKNNFVRTMQ